MNRKEFLLGAVGAAAALTSAGVQAAVPSRQEKAGSGGPKKAVLWGMLPGRLSLEERFQLARDVGFAGVEAPPIAGAGECERMRAAAEKAGIRIHSVIYGGWDPPL